MKSTLRQPDAVYIDPYGNQVESWLGTATRQPALRMVPEYFTPFDNQDEMLKLFVRHCPLRALPTGYQCAPLDGDLNNKSKANLFLFMQCDFEFGDKIAVIVPTKRNWGWDLSPRCLPIDENEYHLDEWQSGHVDYESPQVDSSILTLKLPPLDLTSTNPQYYKGRIKRDQKMINTGRYGWSDNRTLHLDIETCKSRLYVLKAN
jgi:hypothetical protein